MLRLLRVQGLGAKNSDSETGMQSVLTILLGGTRNLDSGTRMMSLFRVEGLGARNSASGIKFEGLGLRLQCTGSKAQGSGFRGLA